MIADNPRLSLTQLLDKRFWIFDLDGTLTQPLHDFVAIRSELGVPVDVGILEYIQLQPEPRRSQLNTRLIEIELDLAYRAEPMPFAQPLIKTLFERGYQLAILTRNRRDCVDIVLQRLQLQDCFNADQIVASECAEPKPSPAGIEQLIEGWNCAGSNCLRRDSVMLGDYLYDLQAGRAAMIQTVHFNPAQGSRWAHLTDLELTSFEPLLTLLQSQP